MTGRHVSHRWTKHGHRCCSDALLLSELTRPLSIARCGGPAICNKCATEAGAIHQWSGYNPPADPAETGGQLDAGRCHSCDHEMTIHSGGGCWFTVSQGALDRDLVCVCTVVHESTGGRQYHNPDYPDLPDY